MPVPRKSLTAMVGALPPRAAQRSELCSNCAENFAGDLCNKRKRIHQLMISTLFKMATHRQLFPTEFYESEELDMSSSESHFALPPAVANIPPSSTQLMLPTRSVNPQSPCFSTDDCIDSTVAHCTPKCSPSRKSSLLGGHTRGNVKTNSYPIPHPHPAASLKLYIQRYAS